MQLDSIIAELLYDHDCVVVPGFGAFLAIHCSAKLNTHSHVIYPPSRNVGFNSRIKHQDGLLTQILAQTLEISMTEAQQKVAVIVTEWWNQLDTEGRIALNGIGVVFQDPAGQLQFVPDREQNFLTSSFGFQPMHLTIVRPDFGSVEQKFVHPAVWSLSSKYVATAIIILLLGASWLMGTNYRKEIGMSSLNPFSPIIECNYTSMAPIGIPPTAELDSEKWMNALKLPEEELLDSSSFDRNLVNAPKPGTTKVPIHHQEELHSASATINPQVTSGFAVIGGAFQDMGNANRFLLRLKKQGYSPAFAGTKGKLQLVAYGIFRTMAEAELAQQDIISNGEPAWIKALK